MGRAAEGTGPLKDIAFNSSHGFFGGPRGSQIFDMDLEGNLLTIPRIIERITGLSHDHLDHISVQCLILNEDRPKIASALESINQGAPMVICEADLLSEKEGSHPVEMVLAPKFSGKEMIGIWGAIKDISRRTALERELKWAKDIQTASQNFLSDLVPVMTREIRQPLTTILLTLEMMDSGFFGELTPSQREKVVQLIEQVDRVKGILSDALSASKEIDTKLSLEKETISLMEILNDVISSRSHLLDERSLKISYQFPAEDIKVEADRKTLVQVVSTLVDYSIKATPEGGQIRIEIADDGENAMFSISDTGSGLTEEEVLKLFEKFRLDGHDDAGKMADGLSIYIAKRMIEGHGGHLWCESFPGIGSTFIFTLKRSGFRNECP
ncbi:MAG: ATP-binding protein [Thermoplasmatota archaeon]